MFFTALIVAGLTSTTFGRVEHDLCLKDGSKKHGDNCGFYVHCLNGIGHIKPCPRGLVFNDDTKTCDDKSNVPRCADYVYEPPMLPPKKCSHYCGHGVCTLDDHQIAECHCNPGYFGRSCDKKDIPITHSCDPNPCHHGGICKLTDDSAECVCDNGFSGPTCKIGIPFPPVYCDEPCGNGACLVNDVGKPVCFCHNRYYGKACENYGSILTGPQ